MKLPKIYDINGQSLHFIPTGIPGIGRCGPEPIVAVVVVVVLNGGVEPVAVAHWQLLVVVVADKTVVVVLEAIVVVLEAVVVVVEPVVVLQVVVDVVLEGLLPSLA